MAEQREQTSSDAATPYSQTAAEHVRELSLANRVLPQLLHRSGNIVSLLTNRPVFAGDTPPTTDPAARANMIKDQTYDLYLAINALRLQLRRQIAELHSHGIIPAQGTKPGTKFMRRPGSQGQGDEEARKAEEEERLKDPEMDVVNGGLGHLDIAVLNARAAVRHQNDLLEAMVTNDDSKHLLATL